MPDSESTTSTIASLRPSGLRFRSPSRLFSGVLPRLLGARQRRIWVSERHAEVEHRCANIAELHALSEWFRDAVSDIPAMEWVDVNPHTRRISFRYEPGAFGKNDLLRLVERAESACCSGDAAFHDGDDDHPADDEPHLRDQVTTVVEAMGLGMGAFFKVLPVGPSRLGKSGALAVAVARSIPRVRARLDDRLGVERAEFVLDLVAPFTQALAQRPLTLFVGLWARTEQLRETASRRGVWKERWEELNEAPAHIPVEYAAQRERPVPLPTGPIEDYAERAWFLSLTGFALSLATTRSLRRAVGALFGAMPQPARLGREVFAGQIGRALARRRHLVMHPGALRRLDRVDCLLLDGELARYRPVTVRQVRLDPSLETSLGVEAEHMVQALFDRADPLRVAQSEGWTLGPRAQTGGVFDDELRRVADDLDDRGVISLGLSNNGQGVAVVEVGIRAEVGAADLVDAARAAGMKVVIAGADAKAIEELSVDDFIGPDEGVRAGIRRLQNDGQVVMLVAPGGSPGFGAADVSIGLCRPGEPTPWGADILTDSDLAETRGLVETCGVSRAVAKQSVNAGLAAATLGTLVSAGGGSASVSTTRVFSVLNLASLASMANGARNAFLVERRRQGVVRDPTPWHALTPEGALFRLGSSESGLSWVEARDRIPVTRRERPRALKLLDAVSDEFFNPLAPLLAAGAGLSAVVGSTADAVFVGGVFGLSAVIGGVQRFRAETAIDDLASQQRGTVLLRRSGRNARVSARDLVKGDIVILRAGDLVPADCRLVESDFLEIDASSITGESLPIRKEVVPSFQDSVADRASMLYEGTTVAAGRGVALVVALGDETEARRGVGVKPERAVGGVEIRLRQLMSLTGPVALAAGAGVIFSGLARGRKMADLVSSAVSLAVSSVPEGLPLLASAAQLAAARRLTARGALVRRARSVEALGRVNVLCFDKTGTVTEGRMGVSVLADGASEERLALASSELLCVLSAGLRATPSRRYDPGSADPTDESIRLAAKARGVDRTRDVSDWRFVDQLPFEPGRGFHAALGRSGDGYLLSVKGAPEYVLAGCTRSRVGGSESALDDPGRDRLFSEAAALARRGLRVLAVAERLAERAPALGELEDLAFCGFIALSDPVRPTAAEALTGIRRAGVDVVMITGDHPSTAAAIASELGLMRGRYVMTGSELARLDDDELMERLPEISAFARVTPTQKVRVVRTLQRMNRVVAMAGDGANDAPAMRLADVGIAVGADATAAARGSADVIVVDGRMETIVDALVEGRAMWASVRDAVSILVGGNLGEIAFSLGGGIVDGRPPLTARQLLLVNLLTDVAPAMAIAVRPPSQEQRDRLELEGPDASLANPLNQAIATRAAATALGAGAAWGLSRLFGSEERARTVGLVALVGSQLAQTVALDPRDRSVRWTAVGSGLVLAGLVQTPGVSGAFGCKPLGPFGWSLAVGGSALGAYAGAKLPVWVSVVEPGVRDTLSRIMSGRVFQLIQRELPRLSAGDASAAAAE